MRLAVRIAYDGTQFHGSARQPDLRTVEGEVEFALRKIGAIRDIPSSRMRLASRTDAGVSALGNVAAFDTAFPPEGIVGAFNSTARDVVATGFAEVPEGFDPRHARSRWYRYLLSGDHDLEALRGHAALFVGEHDFASFCREAGESVRVLNTVEIAANGPFTAVDVRAQGFLWNMVRRIAAALVALETEAAARDNVAAALRGERTVDLGLAAPEPLTLMAVEYDFPLKGALDPATRDALVRRLEALRVRARWLEETLRPDPPKGAVRME